MSTLTDYLLVKHAASLREEPLFYHQPACRSSGNAWKSVREFCSKTWRSFRAYFERQAQEHNQMKNAPENWNNRRGGVYVKGLL
jgi:hypothetical protein